MVNAADNTPQLRAVIFDIDDTLLDWSGSSSVIGGKEHRLIHLSNVYWYVMREVQPLTVSEETFQDTALTLLEHFWAEGKQGKTAPHIGRTLAKTLEALNVPADKIHPEQLMRAYDWSPVPGVVAFPDIYEVLPILRNAGIRTALVTNSGHPMWMRDIELNTFHLLEYFPECRISAADVGHLKPYPEIFRIVLSCLGVSPGEAVFVGDEPYADIIGAHSVGMRAVLRVRPETPMDLVTSTLEEYMIQPDGQINHLHHLLTLLDEWYPTWRQPLTV